jgi:hypothetical protein
VDHIFLTDNASKGSGYMKEKLSKEFPASFLTLQIEEDEHAQMKAYAWCAEEQRRNFNWIGFFDLDEFLYVLDGCVAPDDTEYCLCVNVWMNGGCKWSVPDDVVVQRLAQSPG